MTRILVLEDEATIAGAVAARLRSEGFEVEVDPTNPRVVYTATSQGLYRSADAGRTYANVKLPTGRCAGKTGYANDCMNGNWVTDVEVQEPGGTTGAKGGAVIAAVGYRAGHEHR